LAARRADPDGRELKLLSFNIQAGSSTEKYRHYITRSMQHLLPHPRKARNLNDIAKLATEYDLVALQEVDAGSLRTGFTNQVHYLAERGEFPYWSHQANRRLGRIAETSNGLLSRMEPSGVIDHRLPGAAGRGALEVRFGRARDGLRMIIAHLSLSARAQGTVRVPRRRDRGPPARRHDGRLQLHPRKRRVPHAVRAQHAVRAEGPAVHVPELGAATRDRPHPAVEIADDEVARDAAAAGFGPSAAGDDGGVAGVVQALAPSRGAP